MFKKIIIKCGLLLFLLPIVSCSTISQKNVVLDNLPKHLYFLEKEIQDSSSRKHLILNNIKKDELDDFANDLNAYFKSPMISGGFGEERHYYAKIEDAKKKQYHAGIDVMLKPGKKIFAPADGEIIASYWVRHKPFIFANGIGGVTIERVKVSDIDIQEQLKGYIYVLDKQGNTIKSPKLIYVENEKYKEPSYISTKEAYEKYINSLSIDKKQVLQEQEKYIYFSFMHLSQETTKIFGATNNVNSNSKNFDVTYNQAIDYLHPQKVKKGALIGYVGTSKDNGGWESHIHVEVNYRGRFDYKRIKKYDLQKDISKLNNTWAFIKPMGTFSHESFDWKTYAQREGIVNPNTIYQLYSTTTPVVYLK